MIKKISRKRLHVSPDFFNTQTPFVFGPGIFFISLGMAAIFAPRLLLGLFAGFLLFVGISACYIGWKFIKLKKRFEDTVKNFQDRVYIQAFRVSDPFGSEEFDDDDPKIILH